MATRETPMITRMQAVLSPFLLEWVSLVKKTIVKALAMMSVDAKATPTSTYHQ